MKRIAIVLAVFVSHLVQVHAQQVIKSGGSSNSNFLLGFASYAAKSQCIYLPSDLANATSGQLVALYYKYGSNGGFNQTLYNFTIRMGQTTETSFESGNIFFTDLTSVLSSTSYSIVAGASGTWFPINLNTPFAYDASQTLIIQITFDSCAVNSWGTLGTSNVPVKKIISPDVNATTGSTSSSNWQDIGFDLEPDGVLEERLPLVTFDISPNPCHNKLAIKFPGRTDRQKVNLSMMNILGEIVFERYVLISETMDVDVSDWPKGIYVLRATFGDRQVAKKVILE